MGIAIIERLLCQTFHHFSYRITGCKARMIKPSQNDDEVNFVVRNTHNHPADARQECIKKAREMMKSEAKTTKLTAKEIISNATKGLKRPSIAQLPTNRSLSRSISRVRCDPNAPKNPNTLDELVLDPESCQLDDVSQFLLYDSGTKENSRIVIFGTDENIQFIKQCTELYMDGTFKVVPKLFDQLYTIHGK